MNTLLRDIRYALRALLKNPGFTIAAALSLAIGIGANTAIFSIANALLLRPLPYKDAERLTILWNRSPGLNITQDWFSTAQYFDIKNGHRGFEQVAIAIGGNDNLTGDGDPERVGTIHVSSNLLPMLGQNAAIGRLFLPQEDSAGHALTAVLSYGIWARRFGSDPHMLGRPLLINGKSYEVVGIMPRSFSLPREVLPTLGGAEQAEILLPLPMAPKAEQDRDHEDYNIMGKLKPGVTVQQAQAEMDILTAALRRDHPEIYPPNGGLTFGIVPLREQVVGEVRRSLVILLGAVGFVLLIACANVANLLLARAVGRQKEIAVRTALGASPWRIVRQLLTESILLALCGGALGILFAIASVQGIHILGAKSVPRLGEIGVDGQALLFTLGVSIFSGILFGLAPAFRVAHLDLRDVLNEATRGSAGAGAVWGRGNSLRRLLVISELALSVVLLIAAGLLLRSFAGLQSVHPGFQAKNVLTLELALNGRKYQKPEAALAAYHELWERLEHLPGVKAAGAVTALPLSQMFAWGPIKVEGRAPLPGEKFINADQRVVGGHYFEAMEIPLITGRLFNAGDTTSSPNVAVIDEYMARQLWPGVDPVGKRFSLEDDKKSPWVTIVGVVGRVKQYTLDSDSRIALYLSQTQYVTRDMNVVMRSSTDPAALSAGVKREIRALDPELPLYNVRTMQQRVDESLARRQFSMLLLALFAFLALALAAVGIYGVMVYLVSQGTRELGIRMALGATQRTILALVVRQGMALALSGVFVGLVAALVLTRLMQSLLFGVGATDVVTFVGTALLLSLVSLIACAVPAQRAARIDPMVSLRRE